MGRTSPAGKGAGRLKDSNVNVYILRNNDVCFQLDSCFPESDI